MAKTKTAKIGIGPLTFIVQIDGRPNPIGAPGGSDDTAIAAKAPGAVAGLDEDDLELDLDDSGGLEDLDLDDLGDLDDL